MSNELYQEHNAANIIWNIIGMSVLLDCDVTTNQTQLFKYSVALLCSTESIHPSNI